MTRVLTLFMALAVAGAPISALAVTPGGTPPSSWSSVVADGAAAIVPAGLLRWIEGTEALSSGTDGRLTFLLLGSDTRGGGVERTDTIMVASLRGSTISVLSIPRDATGIPNPDGGVFTGRVNTILKQLNGSLSLDQALAKFERVIENLLGIEIDYHALIKFDGFQHLVQEIQPVSVDIGNPIADARFWDDPNKLSGVYFPAATNYDLYAWQPGPNPLCNGLWRNQAQPIPSSFWCHRALPYVRSRKSTSDYVRARRQQNFVIAAMRRVINRGGGALGSLVSRASWETGKGTLATNIPLNLATALDVYQRLSGAGVGIQVVLAPPTYGSHLPGGAIEVDLAAIRELTRQWFGGSDNPPVPPATTLPTTPPFATPSPGTTSAPQPTTSPGTTGQPTPQPTGPSTPATGPATGGPLTPQPSPTAAPGGESVPPGDGGLLIWAVAAGIALVAAAAVGLLWLRTRAGRGARR